MSTPVITKNTSTAASGVGQQNAFAIDDKGACSKVFTMLPRIGTFATAVRDSLVTLSTNVNSTANAVVSLQATQGSVADSTHFFNYWMGQQSAVLDTSNALLKSSTDNLVVLAKQAPSTILNRPGVPTSLTLIPGAGPDEVRFYWLKPTYTGSTDVSTYNVGLYAAGGTAASNVSDTSEGDYNYDASGDNAYNSLYLMYGANLKMATLTTTSTVGFCATVTAVNTSGINGANLSGSESGKTGLISWFAANSAGFPAPAVNFVASGYYGVYVSWSPALANQSAVLTGYGPIEVGGHNSYLVYGDAGAAYMQSVGDATYETTCPQGWADAQGTRHITVRAMSAYDNTETTPLLDSTFVGPASNAYTYTRYVADPPAPTLTVNVSGLTGTVVCSAPTYYDSGNSLVQIIATNATANVTDNNQTIPSLGSATSTLTLVDTRSYTFSARIRASGSNIGNWSNWSVPVGPFTASA